MKTWSREEILMEIQDAEESLDHWRSSLHQRQIELENQVVRSTEVYGERPHWPGSSEHGVRQSEAAVEEARQHIAESQAYLQDLQRVLAE